MMEMNARTQPSDIKALYDRCKNIYTKILVLEHDLSELSLEIEESGENPATMKRLAKQDVKNTWGKTVKKFTDLQKLAEKVDVLVDDILYADDL